MKFVTPPFVGVVLVNLFGDAGRLKRMMLMFERLAIDLSSRRLTAADMTALKAGRNDFEFLRSEGLLTTDFALVAEQKALSGYVDARRPASGFLPASAERRVGAHLKLAGVSTRLLAAQLRNTGSVDAVAASDSIAGIDIDEKIDRDFVIRVALTALPVPAENTPWEAILDFRRDPQSRVKFARLKNWINRAARSDVTRAEFLDEVEELLLDFENHMRLHKLDTGKGILEVLVTPIVEAAENLAKLQIGKIVKAPFEISRQKFSLLQSEREAPGTEIAYILSARTRF